MPYLILIIDELADFNFDSDMRFEHHGHLKKRLRATIYILSICCNIWNKSENRFN
jgi:hypothetical protein